MPELTDRELQIQLQKLKQDILDFPEDMNSLETELESSAKHIPAYLKIVKSHIEQLAKVLGLEAHNKRNLETAELAYPVQQLIQLFQDLQDDDLQLLEELATTARNWNSEPTKTVDSDESLPTTTASEI